MAQITVCDGGCGKQSPAAEKLHVANHWHRVWVRAGVLDSPPSEQRPDRVFCGDCWGPIREVLKL